MLFETFKWLKACPKMSIYEYLLSFSYLSSAVKDPIGNKPLGFNGLS